MNFHQQAIADGFREPRQALAVPTRFVGVPPELRLVMVVVVMVPTSRKLLADVLAAVQTGALPTSVWPDGGASHLCQAR